jgi:ribonuclease HII
MVGRPTLGRERQLLAAGARVVVGVDEVGRGALAGPVAVGAVAVTAATVIRAPVGIRDSKDLSPVARGRLAGLIRTWCAAGSVGMASAAEIDAWGLTVALRCAALRALSGLEGLPGIDVVLLDGTHDYLGSDPAIPGMPDALDTVGGLVLGRIETEAKADAKRTSVAAASILAKTARDSLMVQLAVEESRYGWERNKGYAAPEHRAALRRWGPTAEHRVSWRLPIDSH